MKILAAFAVIVGGALCAAQDIPRMEYEGSSDQVTLQGQLDWAAVLRTWRIKGVLVCTIGTEVKACLWVENAYPCGVFEVVRQPFRTHLKEGEIVMGLLKDLGLDIQARHGEAMQFADVRAWSWVPA